MKELINNELAQLQKDLEKLQSASRMISQAGEASNSVIEEAKEIHEDFSKNLDNLTSLYTQYLEAANKQSSQNQLLVVDHVKKTISDQSEILDKYTQLVETSNQNTKNLYDKAVESQNDTIAKLSDDATQKINTVCDTYLKQSADTDKLLTSYLELAQCTAELKDKITAVDFPERLDTMSKCLNELSTRLDTLATENSKLKEHQKVQDEQLAKILAAASSDKVLKQTQASDSTIKSVKTLVVTTLFLLILGFAGVVYLLLK